MSALTLLYALSSPDITHVLTEISSDRPSVKPSKLSHLTPFLAYYGLNLQNSDRPLELGTQEEMEGLVRGSLNLLKLRWLLIICKYDGFLKPENQALF